MKRIVYVMMIAALLMATVSPAVQAQDDEEVRKHPGYVDFEGIEIPVDAEETVEVYVSGPLLKLVATATRREDPDLSSLLSKLLLVKVYTFSIDSDLAENLKPKIRKIESNLKDQKWERIVKVKDRFELTHVYMKMNRDEIIGLVVMSIDREDEAVFVNIVGEIDMDAIGKLGRKFDIPELEYLEEEDEG